MGDNVKEYGAQQRGGHKKHQRQFGVDGKGHGQGDEHHHRRAERGAHARGHRVLDGGDVAGQPRDQGGGAEFVGVGKGELLQLLKFRLADFGPQPLAGGGGEVGVPLAQRQADQGEQNHLKALHQNVAPVAVCHAHVDNLGHHQGDDQLKGGFRLDAEDGQHRLPAVRL